MTRATHRTVVVIAAGIALIAAVALRPHTRPLWAPACRAAVGKRSVGDVLRIYGEKAGRRFLPRFDKAGAPYPPRQVALLGLKAEKRLELWAEATLQRNEECVAQPPRLWRRRAPEDTAEGGCATRTIVRDSSSLHSAEVLGAEKDGRWVFVYAYRILGASGKAGPKLREGDRQVPEGVYGLEYLNPNSNHHLSMKINYPNAFDRKHAQAEGRTQPGGDIFIHGGRLSIGCIAIGDHAIEELFVLVVRVGKANVRVIIAPNDLRKGKPITDLRAAPPWVPELYRGLEKELRQFNVPPKRKDAK